MLHFRRMTYVAQKFSLTYQLDIPVKKHIIVGAALKVRFDPFQLKKGLPTYLPT